MDFNNLVNFRKIKEISDGDSVLYNDILIRLISDVKLIEHLFDLPLKKKKKLIESRLANVTQDVIACRFFEYYFERRTPIGSPDMNHEINEKIFIEICVKISNELKKELENVNS